MARIIKEIDTSEKFQDNTSHKFLKMNYSYMNFAVTRNFIPGHFNLNFNSIKTGEILDYTFTMNIFKENAIEFLDSLEKKIKYIKDQNLN